MLLESLVLDERFQVRSKLDAGAITRYATLLQTGGQLPPIEVAQVGEARILVDGWHRVYAMRRIGVEEAEANVTVTTEREALWLAAKANLSHGVPLKKKEIREVFRAYVRSRQHLKGKGTLKAYREIERDLGLVKHTTLFGWMKKDFPDVARRMAGGKGGPGGGPPATDWTGVLDGKRTEALEALQAARDAFNGVTDPGDRREVLEEARRVAAEMERAGNIGPADDCPF